MEIEEGVIDNTLLVLRNPVSTLRSAMIPFYVIYVIFIPTFFF